MPVVAKQKQLKFFYEEIFRSINKFIMDLITWEVLFFNDFFEMNPHLSSNFLNLIFKNTVTSIYDFIKKYIINKCTDFFAVSLMIITNYEQARLMDNRKLSHLDPFFDLYLLLCNIGLIHYFGLNLM